MVMERPTGRPDPRSARSGLRPRSPAELLEPSRAPVRPVVNRRRVAATAEKSNKAVAGFAQALSGILTMLLLVMGTLGAAGILLHEQFTRLGPLQSARTVVIEKGDGPIEIAEQLEREGIITNRWTFVAGHYLEGLFGGRKAATLKAGEYEIGAGSSMREILRELAEGRAILAKLTIPEGLTSWQIVELVKAEPTLEGEIGEVPSEGSLLPDTYRFQRGTQRAELIQQMQSEMSKVLAQAWEGRNPNVPLSSPQHALVLSSIVEKETGRADERERVAAVFVNRMKKRMRLQSDPTVIYGIAGGQGPLGRSITRSDLDGRTAYNTYVIDGLPPTPICNPGKHAIEAALKPAETADLYFVANGSGGHDFSETLKQHNEAVANWRRLEREQRARQDGVEANERATAADQDAIPSPGTGEAPPEAAAADTTEAGAASAAEAAAKPINTSVSAVPLPVRKPAKR